MSEESSEFRVQGSVQEGRLAQSVSDGTVRAGREAGPATQRCNGCGGLVYVRPCVLCRTRYVVGKIHVDEAPDDDSPKRERDPSPELIELRKPPQRFEPMTMKRAPAIREYFSSDLAAG